jgi:hypothetical protein
MIQPLKLNGDNNLKKVIKMKTMIAPMKNFRIICTCVVFISTCVGCKRSTYDVMKAFVDEIRVINTHSHQAKAWMERYNCFDAGLYLHADLVSAGMPEYPDAMKTEHDPEAYWNHTEEYLRFSRTTSYYTQFIINAISESYFRTGSGDHLMLTLIRITSGMFIASISWCWRLPVLLLPTGLKMSRHWICWAGMRTHCR